MFSKNIKIKKTPAASDLLEVGPGGSLAQLPASAVCPHAVLTGRRLRRCHITRPLLLAATRRRHGTRPLRRHRQEDQRSHRTPPLPPHLPSIPFVDVFSVARGPPDPDACGGFALRADLLYKDYNTHQKFSVTTCSPHGVVSALPFPLPPKS